MWSGGASAIEFVTTIRTTVQAHESVFQHCATRVSRIEAAPENQLFSLQRAASPNWISTGALAIATIATLVGQLMMRVTRGHAGRGNEGSALEPRLGTESKHSEVWEVLAFISKKASTLSTSPFDMDEVLETTKNQPTDPRVPRHIPGTRLTRS